MDTTGKVSWQRNLPSPFEMHKVFTVCVWARLMHVFLQYLCVKRFDQNGLKYVAALLVHGMSADLGIQRSIVLL